MKKLLFLVLLSSSLLSTGCNLYSDDKNAFISSATIAESETSVDETNEGTLTALESIDAEILTTEYELEYFETNELVNNFLSITMR